MVTWVACRTKQCDVYKVLLFKHYVFMTCVLFLVLSPVIDYCNAYRLMNRSLSVADERGGGRNGVAWGLRPSQMHHTHKSKLAVFFNIFVLFGLLKVQTSYHPMLPLNMATE